MAKTIMRWMKKNIGLGASIAHCVLRRESNGIYITACGKANGENFIELTDEEKDLVKYDERARCKSCDISPRALRPENIT